MAPGVAGVDESPAACQETGASRDGIRNEGFQAIKRGVRHHGADVGVGAQAKGSHAGGQHLYEPVVGAGGNDALDADAVLAGGLEGAPEDHVGYAGQVLDGRVEHDEGILAAEFGHDGRQALGGAGGDVVRDRPRPDKGDVADGRVRGEMGCRLGPAHDGLDQLGIVAVGGQRPASNGGKPRARPGRLLRDLDDNGVAREQGADDGAHHVVEGVVPADERGHHAQGLVVHRVALVRHEEACRARRRPQRLLAVQQRPLYLFHRDENLAQVRVDQRLPAVERRNPAYLAGIVHDMLHQGAQHGLSLAQGRPGP